MQPRRFGLIALATDLTIEADAARLMPEGTRLHVTRIAFDNPTTPDNLRATAPRIADAAGLLVPGVPLDGIGFGCTSAGALLGDAVAKAVVAAGRDGVPVTTPTAGARRGLAAMGLRRIALLTPYLPMTTIPVREDFGGYQIEVVSDHSLGFADDRDMAQLSPEAIIAGADAADSPDAQALFVSCTAVPVLSMIPALEARLGKPVISANQALFWAMLDQARIPAAGPGALFRVRTW